MKRVWVVTLAVLLAAGIAHPISLLCQESPPPETYNGEPMCRSGRGVYPHPTYQPDPEYDNSARKKRIQGTVLLSTVVNKEGHAEDIQIVKSLTPGLDKQALKALQRWRFEPVMQDGKPCPMKLTIEMSFHLY